MEFKKTTLDNGLTIIGEVNPAAQSSAVGFFTRTGSRDENAQINGVSHFLEHMMFKGTDKLSALEVNKAFDRLGAKFNAFTSEESTVYYAAVLPEYLQDVTDLWSQLMRPSLRDDDFEMEKNVIKEEIAMYKDMPQFDVVDKCRELHFGVHPCGHSVLGTNESIDAMTAEQMREYFARRYAPDNMVVSVCGNIDFDAVADLVAQKCGHWQPSNAGREPTWFSGTGECRVEENENLMRAHICLMSPAVSMQDEKRFAASLLGTIIGDTTGSRYFWRLVDNALAETAVVHLDSMDGVGVYYSYVQCDKANVNKVLDIIRDVLAEVHRDGVTQAELDKARNKLLSSMAIRSEQPMGRLVGLGFNWMYLQEYRSLADDVEAIRGVTLQDIDALLAEHSLSEFTQYVLTPPVAE
ncbi:Protease 3 precursor [Anaerohalosphaera lusitana]|uniref:Protease 3 n=1 Tax=Anaerohalosphaera lusitana TaxID=1936003 RepID=A0A1U9NM95_9BACT|nr:pitrilysin family protein [Anaerohalosphaera lusitana]AQT68955.1 Protease 3 precursor [Anaerohalosphaera lusitana]